MSKVL